MELSKYTQAATVVAASTISGMLGYGTYGYYRDKGMSTWKAGALTGLVAGAIGAVVMLALPAGVIPGYQLQATQPQIGALRLMPTGGAPRRLRWR
jgi:hypothetical protein